jgi:hypothetical protein
MPTLMERCEVHSNLEVRGAGFPIHEVRRARCGVRRRS